MALQGEIADDLGSQQARHVGRRRDLEAGPQLLGHAGPAHELAPFEDEHPAARPAEIGGRDQTVVTGPDDDGIVAEGHDRDSPATCNTRRPATQRPVGRRTTWSLPAPARGGSLPDMTAEGLGTPILEVSP